VCPRVARVREVEKQHSSLVHSTQFVQINRIKIDGGLELIIMTQSVLWFSLSIISAALMLVERKCLAVVGLHARYSMLEIK
jgi:hypothetical protein